MAINYWMRQLAALSLLVVAPIQSLQISLSASHQRICRSYPRTSVISMAAASNGNNIHNIEHIGHRHVHKQREYQFPLFAISNEIGSIDDGVEIDEDLDAFLEELSEESAAAAASSTNDETKAVETASEDSRPHFIQGKTAVGIGGNDGFVYDVNALKRNLVQESVRGCKQELLVLLGDGRQNDEDVVARSTSEYGKQKVVVPPRWKRDRDDLIEERLSSLVQANPVSTTTDSNLLDGEWSFAFATNSASTILDTSRFLLSKTKRIDTPVDIDENVVSTTTVRGGPWRFRAGKTENPFRSSTRQIYLENLIGDENAHIVDETRLLGGLFQISQRYDVYGLTRTAIDLDITKSESKLLGFCVSSNSGRDDYKGTIKQGQQSLEIQVLYLDSDLCICTTGAGLDGPLHVYTKSDLWVAGGTKRKLRLIAKTASWVSTMQSPLRIRQRVMNAFAKKNNGPKKAGTGSKAVNIGELDMNADGSTREDPAWDGPDDPFMHLSPGERMEVLKTMSLQDIYQSAVERKEQNKKQKKKWGGKNRGNKFKRPDI